MMKKQRVLIRRSRDDTFEHGVVDLAVSDNGNLLLIAVRGFEVLNVEDALYGTCFAKKDDARTSVQN